MRERERQHDDAHLRDVTDIRNNSQAETRERANELLRAADGIIERALTAGSRTAFLRATRQESGQ